MQPPAEVFEAVGFEGAHLLYGGTSQWWRASYLRPLLTQSSGPRYFVRFGGQAPGAELAPTRFIVQLCTHAAQGEVGFHHFLQDLLLESLAHCIKGT